MEIKIIAEKKTSIPKPAPIGCGWVCSTYYIIKECTINGKKVIIHGADIETSDSIEYCYGGKPVSVQDKRTQLILRFWDGMTLSYNVQSLSGKDEGNIRTLKIEVDDEVI